MKKRKKGILFPAPFITALTLSHGGCQTQIFCEGCKSLFCGQSCEQMHKRRRQTFKSHKEGIDTGKFLNLKYSYCAAKFTANNPQMYSTWVCKAVTVRGVKEVLSMFIE